MLKIIFFSLFCFSITVSAEQMMIKVIPLNNRPASELQTLIQPFLENSEYIAANQSSLIIKASPPRLGEIQQLIKQLDTRLHNLTITVIQTKSKTSEQLNTANYLTLKGSLKHSADFQLNAKTRYAENKGSINKDITQHIKTIEGKAALIKTGAIHPIQNINIYNAGHGYAGFSSNTQLIEATTGFMVTAHLTGEQVVLQVQPWSKQLNNKGTFSNQGSINTVQVKLGEWIEIGGSSENSRNISRRNLSRQYSTAQQNLKILIKIEKDN